MDKQRLSLIWIIDRPAAADSQNDAQLVPSIMSQLTLTIRKGGRS